MLKKFPEKALKMLFGLLSDGKPEPEPKIWDITEHQRWGDRIGWLDFARLRLTGHTTPHPEPGDILLCPMKGGKIGKFRFKAVEGCALPKLPAKAVIDSIKNGTFHTVKKETK